MAFGVFDMQLLQHVFSTEELRNIFCEQARVQKWYDFEAALALEQAELGIIPRAAAQEIAAKAKVEDVDLVAIGAEVRNVKHPLVPALRALSKLCRGDLGEYVHFGPTTQDVLDTGTMLQLKEAHAIFLRDLKEVGRLLYKLADEHRATPMTGRTHAVQALPITFGHKCAVWLSEVSRHYERFRQLEARVFVGSLVGAVGTQASYGDKAFELDARVMQRLGLGVADINWQPARDRFAEYANLIALAGGTFGKIGNEILNCERNEIDELEEPFNVGKVGSSTMPHKRNPSICENLVTLGRMVRPSAQAALEAMFVEHERDGAVWRMEWKALPESCMMMGAMLFQMKYVLSGLVVRPHHMLRNLKLLGGFLLSERVMFAIADKVGKQTAHELVYEASMRGLEGGMTFEQALFENARVRAALSDEELRAALDPATYIGFAPQIVDRVLQQQRALGWMD
ncbi:MAG: adenylosuccinate lyase [Burkholderiales bacterium]|nr:adenylosuccinate lyase [Burkholderiales bacterium]